MKNGSKKVLVCGANGRTGRAVVAALAKAGVQVRAFIRNEAQAEFLLSLGATECAIGDLDNPESIAAAMESCDKLVFIGPPMHPQETEFVGHLIGAARQVDLSHFVYYSVMHPLRREVRHHRLKLDAEEALIESGLTYTILQPSRYMQHLDPIWPKVLSEGIHAMPFSAEQKFSVVDLRDLAEAVATVVSRDSDHFATYELAGPEQLSQADMAAAISSIIDRPVSAEAYPLEALQEDARKKGVPDDKIAQMLVMNRHYDLHGFMGNANVLRWILGREPTRFQEYVMQLAG